MTNWSYFFFLLVIIFEATHSYWKCFVFQNAFKKQSRRTGSVMNVREKNVQSGYLGICSVFPLGMDVLYKERLAFKVKAAQRFAFQMQL